MQKVFTRFHWISINYLNLQQSRGKSNEAARNSMNRGKSSMNGGVAGRPYNEQT